MQVSFHFLKVTYMSPSLNNAPLFTEQFSDVYMLPTSMTFL